MKRRLCCIAAAMCLLLVCVSCIAETENPVGTAAGVGEPTESVTEGIPAPAEAESLSDFIARVYRSAVPAEKDCDDLEETLGPGDLLPPECLPAVAEGVVGSTVAISLRHDQNDVFVRIHPAENGMTLAIVAANGAVSSQFRPLLLLLDVADTNLGRLVEGDARVQGQIRAVCFLDGNEYFFAASSMFALAEEAAGSTTVAADGYVYLGADGRVFTAERNGGEFAQVVDDVFERMYGRYGVTIP